MNQCGLPPQIAAMPNSLYHSLKGEYFVGYADNMFFENDHAAWAAIENPSCSNVDLFVNVWTVTELSSTPVFIQIVLNSKLPGEAKQSKIVTPTNTLPCAPTRPQARIIQASDVCGKPKGGAEAYERLSTPGATLADEEEGKFIIRPGGNFALFIYNMKCVKERADVTAGFGWWEQKVCKA